MVPLYGDSHLRSWVVPRPLARGVVLSAGLHLLALAALFLLVTRPGSRSPGAGSGDAEMFVDLSAAEPAAAEQGPALRPSGPDPQNVYAPSRRVATAARRVPAPARSMSARPASAPAPAPARGKSGGTTRGSPRLASRPAPPAPAAAPPAKSEPLVVPADKAPQAGRPGPSARAAFLAQMKRQLRASWHAAEVYVRIDPQGKLVGSMLVTGLQVRLRADGTVEKSELRDSSGIHDLDMEAMDTMQRVKSLGQVPAELLDARGGFDVRCTFHLDVGLYRFANELHEAIAQQWRPSKAYAATMEIERKTIVRLLLTKQGALTEAKVVSSAGIDFLDQGAVAWARPGMQFPPPPPAFGKGEGPVPIFVAFLHLAGEPRVLKPREDLEAE